MLLLIVLVNVIVIREAYTTHTDLYFILLITMPLFLLVIVNTRQKKDVIWPKVPKIKSVAEHKQRKYSFTIKQYYHVNDK